MTAHFNSFTPEAMSALRHQLDEKAQRRSEFISNSCKHTSTMLAGFRKHQNDAEAQRRERAAREADRRRQFMSRLRSRVHSLLDRFEMKRKERAEDLQEMNHEFRSASESFRAG
ncbi:hypothetical protein [Hyalangium gracile]|uniref:hypothetical protein n=1 Tax=Hyalangium gracile TaxID=394092 RepID=UPI001CCBB4D3|nr:hypothetical protein [Hyalangium gracile]